MKRRGWMGCLIELGGMDERKSRDSRIGIGMIGMIGGGLLGVVGLLMSRVIV